MSSSSFEPALPSVMADLHFESGAVASLTVSIYTLGYCLGPLVIAPIGELYGRAAALYPGFILFLASLSACGATTSLPVFIVFRALMGVAGMTFVLLGPAVIADLVPRGKSGLALSAMSIGPVVVRIPADSVTCRRARLTVK